MANSTRAIPGKTLSRLVFAAMLTAAIQSTAEEVVIHVNAAKAGPAVNPRMYGIFLEEINHGVDGGLYAELIRNRAFEDSRPPEGYVFENGRWQNRQGFDSGYTRYGYSTNGIPFWSRVQRGEARGSMHLQTTGGITEESRYCLRLEAESVANGAFGIANQGFFGIGVLEHEQYRLSLYARGGTGFEGPLTIRLETVEGEPCSDEVSIQNIKHVWSRHEGALSATATTSNARLVMRMGGTGTVWLDFVSLFPAKTWMGRPNGLRPDIAQMIADLHPGFVRFPGGCVVEAGSTETAYDWKVTVGPLEHRTERWGPWNYRRTQGMGLFEYLQFCEDLGAEPLYVGFAGQTCIFRAPELVPMEDMGWVRDNFLDVVKYANDPADSKWGALRAKAGHRDPFDLKLVEIGNENQGPEFGKRYRFIYDALKSESSNLTFVADLSWTSRESMQGAHFDIEDQHYYNSPRWFASRFDAYDGRDRGLPPLYLGEVAVTTGEAGPLRGNLLAALSEGVFLMGCERNADVVQMVSYAPLLAHVEGRTELTGAPPPWHAMIYFDATRVFGTASYYLWKMFGENRPDQVLATTVSFPDAKPVVIAGQIGVGTWADTAEYKEVRVEQNGQTLYASDFANGAEGWRPAAGRWTADDGVYRQGRMGQGFSYCGDETWTDYTLSLKARNTGGAEGFLIIFGRHGSDRYWWNLGGWGNTQHAIEYNQSLVGRPVPGRIERNRWYAIKVELSGPRIRCYLDGELVHDAVVPRTRKFHAVSGRHLATGDIILKAINLGEEAVAAQLSVDGVGSLMNDAECAVLTSAALRDNNSLTEPERVVPKLNTVSGTGRHFTHEFPPHSFSVLRLKAR